MASETQVVTTNELLTDPSEVQDQKREIRDDVFTTVEEAPPKYCSVMSFNYGPTSKTLSACGHLQPWRFWRYVSKE